jgi:Leucine-rich repeat (LRR) protein
MIGQMNLFSSVPRDLQSKILAMVICDDNLSLLRVCKHWFHVIIGNPLNNLPTSPSSLGAIWTSLKCNPPLGLIPLKHHMEIIETRLENQSRCYDSLFKELVEIIKQTHSTKVKSPFSEIQYEQIQAKAQVQLDESLFAIWPKIQEQLKVPLPPTSAQEIRSWLNNPENKTELDRITKLNLNWLGLRILPPEIGNFSALQRLWLGNHNQLQSIPDTIGNLTALQELHLDNNQLQSIPDTIGNLTALQELHLDNNQLQSIPDTIGNLTALQELHLHNNQLQHLPDTIGNLSALQTLSLNNNQLQSLPCTIENLSTLQMLCLSTNPFTFIPSKVLNSSHKIFSENQTVEQFKEELKFLSSFPLAKLYQAIMRRADVKEIKNAFCKLSDKDQSLVSGKPFHFSKNPQTEDLQWGEHHLFDFYHSVRSMITSKYQGLDLEAKNTVVAEIYRLSPLTEDRYSAKVHAFDNLPRLADAMHIL